ncbi:hypothetical protein ACOJKV_004354, partial [Escherichia coli]
PSYTKSVSWQHHRRLLPGRRHLGGRHFGFRVASLRILFTVFFNAKANSSTVISSGITDFIEEPISQ